MESTPPNTESIMNLSWLLPLLTINFSELVSLTAVICTNSPDGQEEPALILR